ncbi:MAG TPA: ComEC/Rec2 family competence protein, partial [Gammaproteobacteria bacterium]|nr:ComEC/Rec2 family competence protein [Gammaproteobacteria bacterium]
MASSALALLCGSLFLQGFRELPDVFWVSGLPLVLLLFFFSPRLRIPALFVAGLLWALLHAHLYFNHVLPEDLAGDEIRVTGRVADLPQIQGRAIRFDFAIDSGELPVQRLRLAWYANPSYTGLWPRAGERWQLKVKLKPPHGTANPGGFDYEMWLYQRGIHATGYVREDDDNYRLTAAPWWSVDALRQ